jgi:hypothetical protein
MGGFLVAALFALAATVAAAEPAFDELWLPSGDLAGEPGGGWDALAEAPSNVADDPDLVGWGVRSRETRHYTRHRDGFS